MPRYLVVANQTLGGEQLMDEIRRRIAARLSSFYVLVPQTTPRQALRARFPTATSGEHDRVATGMRDGPVARCRSRRR